LDKEQAQPSPMRERMEQVCREGKK